MEQTTEIDYLAPTCLAEAIGSAGAARECFLENKFPAHLLDATIEAGKTDSAFARLSKVEQVAILDRINAAMQDALREGQDDIDISGKIKAEIPKMTTAGQSRMTSICDMLLVGQYGNTTASNDADTDNLDAPEYKRNFERDHQLELIKKAVEGYSGASSPVCIADLEDELGFKLDNDQKLKAESMLEELDIKTGYDFEPAPALTNNEQPTIAPQGPTPRMEHDPAPSTATNTPSFAA